MIDSVQEPADSPHTITRLLRQFQRGDRTAFDALIPLIYDELHAIAHRHHRQWNAGETMRTTALVNDAYLKLAQHEGAEYLSHSHFLAVASRAMRQILSDYARSRQAAKRGGEMERVPLDKVEAMLQASPLASGYDPDGILALDHILKRLEGESERHARIVDCRVFGGMSIEETAQALGISPATVKRGWTVAQAWLRRELQARSEPSNVEEGGSKAR